jgi:hypothetical protein
MNGELPDEPASMAETQNSILILEINSLSVPPIQQKNSLPQFVKTVYFFPPFYSIDLIINVPTAHTLMQYKI